MKYLPIFLILLLIGGTIYFTNTWKPDPEQVDPPQLVQLDTLRVTHFTIQRGDASTISFIREADQWLASDGIRSFIVATSRIRPLLDGMSVLGPGTLISKDEKDWRDYGVHPAEALHIQIYENNDLLEDFYLGKLSSETDEASWPTYMRLNKQSEIYGLPGTQAAIFGRSFNQYREKTLLKLSNHAKITSITRIDTQVRYVLETDSAGWLLNGQRLEESSGLDVYRSGLYDIQAIGFADNFDEVLLGEPLFQLNISGINMDDAPTIDLFMDTTLQQPDFVLRSSRQPDLYLLGDSSLVWGRLFPKLNFDNK